MGFFKKIFGDAADELKKNFEDAKKEMRNNLEEMKRNTMTGFTASTSNSRDDDEEDEEPKILLGDFRDGVLTIREGITELDNESLEHYKHIRKIVFPASLESLDSDVINEQNQLEELDFSKVDKLKTIPDEFIYGENKIRKFVIPNGVTEVGDGFLGEAKSGAEIFVPASVEKLGYITGASEKNMIVYLFAADIEISDVEEDVKTLYVLPDYYDLYAKKLKDCNSEARLRDMPEEMMNFYGFVAPKEASVSRPALESKQEIEEKPNTPANGGLFSARLEAMIAAALQDGFLTDKEREMLKRRVEKEGEDWDEVEMIIEARLAEMRPTSQPKNGVERNAVREKDTVGASSIPPIETKPEVNVPILDDPIFDENKAERYYNERNVVIPEGYTEIEEEAFYGYDKLQSICLPSTLEKINDKAFMKCSKLKQIDFSRCTSLIEIGDKAFYSCEKLEEIVLPDSVKIIGDDAFYFCSKLRKIVMPSSLEKLGDDFYSPGFCGYKTPLEEVDMSKVTKLTIIPKGFTTGGHKQMVIPMGVTTIRDGFFFARPDVIFLPPTLKDYKSTESWESVYLFASPLEEMDNIFENSDNLYVLPQYLNEYKSIQKALGNNRECKIHTMPDEYMFFYDN